METEVQRALRELVEAVTRAYAKYQDMLCAAFVVKRGVSPVICTTGHGLTSTTWVRAPEGDEPKYDRAAVEARLGEELHVLAARYWSITKVRPEDACIRVALGEGNTVVVQFWDMTLLAQAEAEGSGSSPPPACAPAGSLPDS